MLFMLKIVYCMVCGYCTCYYEICLQSAVNVCWLCCMLYFEYCMLYIVYIVYGMLYIEYCMLYVVSYILYVVYCICFM